MGIINMGWEGWMAAEIAMAKGRWIKSGFWGSMIKLRVYKTLSIFEEE
jgi:hypothetical protein